MPHSAVNEQTVQALRKAVADLEAVSATIEEARQEFAEQRAADFAALAELRRKHDEEMATERAALENDKAEWSVRVKQFVSEFKATSGV